MLTTKQASSPKFSELISRWLLVIAILLFFIVALWGLSQVFWGLALAEVYNRLVGALADNTEFPLPLIKAGVVATVVIPLVWGAGDMLAGNKLHRRRTYTIIALYFIAYNFVLYGATKNANFRSRDGTAIRYCARTPAGLDCADRPGVDSRFGIVREPMSPAKVEELEAFDNRIRGGKFASITITRDTPAFNPATGHALLYYTLDSNGGYRWSQGPGFDVTTGLEAQPVTPAILDAYWQQQAEFAVEAQARAAQALADQKLAADTAVRSARKAELAAIFQADDAQAGAIDVAVSLRAVTRDDHVLLGTLTDALGAGLRDAKVHPEPIAATFRDSKGADGMFAGDLALWREARSLGMLADVDRVVLGTLSADCETGYQETIRCELSFETRAFDGDGNLLGTNVTSDISAGFNRRDATREGVSRIADKLRVEARQLVQL